MATEDLDMRNSPGAMLPWTVRLPGDTTAPGVARAAISEWLRDVEPYVRHAARSVVSELVANALRQGRPPLELSVEQSGDRVRVEVADGGDTRGRQPPACWSRQIVQGLALRWGVRGDDAHVWFELPITEPEPGHD